MRLGILTFHRAHNYGAVLQTYALQQCLQSMGHDVWVIDYRQPAIEKAYRVFDFKTWLKMLLRLRKQTLTYLLGTAVRRQRKKYFESFVANHLHPTGPCSAETIPQDFDGYIIGSDQVWNWQWVGGVIDKVYLGQFKRPANSKLFGYAISTNMGSLDLIGADTLKQLQRTYTALSVREEHISKVIHCLTAIKPQVCCDPTLLTDATFWDAVTNDKYSTRKYVLAYQVGKIYKQPTLLRDKAQALADELHCEMILVDVASAHLPVEDVVSLFKYAQYVVCTSFHGTAFSLIFERPFYTIKLHQGNDNRFAGLLSLLGAEDRCVEADTPLKPIPMDYTSVSEALKKYRQNSLEFLQSII